MRGRRSVAGALGLQEGDDIEIVVAGERRFEIARKPSSRQRFETIRKYRGSLPVDFRFDRLEATGRGE